MAEIDSVSTGVGGDAVLTVAATDTPDILKDRADYICDGTIDTGGDQVEINAALVAADIVYLCPGTFYEDGSVVLASGQSLISDGATIKFMNAFDLSEGMIINSDIIGGNDHILLKGLKLDGNETNQSGGNQKGVYFVNVSPSGTTPGCKIDGCIIENFRSRGIYLYPSYNSVITGNTCRNTSVGIYLRESHYNTIIGNTVMYGISNGIMLNGGNGNIISENISRLNAAMGISISNASHNTIVANYVTENSQVATNMWDNINISQPSHYNNVQGNTSRAGGQPNKPRYGIFIENLCNGNMVTNNDIYDDGFGTASFFDDGVGTITAPGNRT